MQYLVPPHKDSGCCIDYPGLAAHHRLYGPGVVPPRLHRGYELGKQLLPLALPRLKLFDPSEHLNLEPGHIKIGF